MSTPSDKAKSLDEILAEMQAVAEKATAAPWSESAIANILVSAAKGAVSNESCQSNAAFIAMSREALPRLIAALRKCYEQRDEHVKHSEILFEFESSEETERLDAELVAILQGRA